MIQIQRPDIESATGQVHAARGLANNLHDDSLYYSAASRGCYIGETLGTIVQFAVVTFTSIFFLVDPFAAIPAFLAMTMDTDRCDRRKLARRAAITCFLVLTLFGFAGSLIFKVFGITMPAFRIAGGLILLLIGLEMLQAKRSHTQELPDERKEGEQKEDVGVIPLGSPMLAGP